MGHDNGKPPAEQSPRWYAEQYVALGWRVLPLHCVVNGVCTCPKGAKCGNHAGKHPRTHHGHEDASTDFRKVKLWRWETANVGIATGVQSGILVLDIDPRNGGNESFERLCSQLGTLPTCPEVSTGGGGRHLYFRHPGVELKDQESIPGIDIKTDGGVVVAPPSVHFSGGVYKWRVSPRKSPPPEMPTKWRESFAVTQTTEVVT
jgi:putative DNA primase/helicase